MNNHIAVSVVIAAYNAEPYVAECLDSIVNQSLSNIEIIFVNDGSTDKTLEIAKAYAEKDSRIIILDEKNEGAAASRNKGLACAKGEYLSILDADDIFDRKMLEKSYAHACKHDADIVFFRFGALDMNSGKIMHGRGISLPSSVKEHENLTGKNFNFNITTPAAWNKLFKKNFIDNYKISFQNLSTCNDIGFTRCAMAVAMRIYHLNEELVTYRLSTTNTTSSRYLKAENIIEAAKFIRDFINKNNKKTLLSNLYEALISNMAYEYNQFPQNVSPQKYLMKVYDFLPEEYHEKFTSSLTRRFDNKHLISVIVPVYNVESYLRECVDSIINQTFKDFEIIIVNDGSTDNSASIIKEYEKKHKNITVINQKNSGLAKSRNNAMAIAKGKYMLCLDSDDYLHENTLEKLCNRMEKHDLDMLSFSGVNFVDGSKEFQNNEYWMFRYLPEGFNSDTFTWKDCKSFMHRMAVSSCLTMYKLDFIKQHNISFPDHLCFEDNVFFIKSITKAKRCGITKDKFYYRRIHSASITQNWAKNFGDYIKISDMVLSYLKSINMEKSVYEAYRSSYVGGSLRRYQSFEPQWQEKYRSAMVALLKKYQWPVETLTPVKLWFGTDNVNGEKKIFFCKKAIYHRMSDQYKKRIALFGIEIFKRRISADSRKVFLLGIEVYKKKQVSSKTRISILGIPVYSVKKKDYEVTRRILFIKYKKRNRLQAIQDKLFYNQQQLQKLAKELADSRKEIATLRNEVKAVASKPRRFILTEVEDK